MPDADVLVHRVDYGNAILTGEKPIFAPADISFAASFAAASELSTVRPEPAPGFELVLSTVERLDLRLGNILQDLHGLSQLANALSGTGQTMRARSLQQLLTSLQYRLLGFECGEDVGLAELVRLSLLAYLSTLFLSVPGLRLPFGFLGRRMEAALKAFTPVSKTEHHLYAWCLVVGAISMLRDPREDWIRQRLAALVVPCLGSTRAEAQGRLREVAWIDVTHGTTGFEVVSEYFMTELVQDQPQETPVDVFEGSLLQA